MAGSKPEIRADVLERLEPGVVLRGDTLGEIRDQLGIAQDDVSNTQFSKAVRSLHYNHGQVTLGRHWSGDVVSQTKGYYLGLR